jgi:hypothetical protein
MTHHPKVKGSNPATGIKQVLIKFGCALEAHSTLNLMIECSNFRRNKMAKKFLSRLFRKERIVSSGMFLPIWQSPKKK